MKILGVFLLAVLLPACAVLDGPGQKAGHDVVVCHKGKTMSLPEEAAPGHINHGDRYGPC